MLNLPLAAIPSLATLSLACCGAENRKIPATVNAALVANEPRINLDVVILRLLSHFNNLEHDKASFHASFPVEFFLERSFVEILPQQLDVEQTANLLNFILVLPNSVPFLVSLHPFVIRGLGSTLLRYSLNDLSLHDPNPTSEVDETNIVNLAAAFFNSIMVTTFDELLYEITLPSLCGEVNASINIASLSSLLHLLNSLRRLTKRINHLDSDSRLAVWKTFRICLTQLRFHLPPFIFIALFEADETECLSHLLDDQPPKKIIRMNTVFEVSQLTRSLYLHDSSVAFSGNEEILRIIRRRLLSSIPAFRSTAFVILSKLCTPDNVDMVLVLCRLGVVECVMKAVERSRSLDECEMGVSILGSLLRTLAFSQLMHTMVDFDFSTPFDSFPSE
ncbi:hypothetical protein BLNAU_1614 [Blattamonas nauphoetae]|uniref:Uncharacterized protein n=1 Tax=Blattamonas nauphoetae TaxID=2049346 RepID=A0ABQ9YII7_9EUKA|nr:hypothetical protein BLNAU_1614 [Blattamonas nauphoetae]